MGGVFEYTLAPCSLSLLLLLVALHSGSCCQAVGISGSCMYQQKPPPVPPVVPVPLIEKRCSSLHLHKYAVSDMLKSAPESFFGGGVQNAFHMFVKPIFSPGKFLLKTIEFSLFLSPLPGS